VAEGGDKPRSGWHNPGHAAIGPHATGEGTLAMAVADVIAIILLLMSVAWGMMRGFTREVFGLLAWICAFVLAMRWYGAVLPWVAAHVPGLVQSRVVAFSVVFVGLVVAFSVVSAFVGNLVQGSSLLGGVNTLLGGAFGLLRGVVVLTVLYAAGSLTMTDATFRGAVEGSRLAPFIYHAALYLERLGPVFTRVHLAPPGESVHDPAI